MRIRAKLYTYVNRNIEIYPNLPSNHPFARDHTPACDEHSTRGKEPSALHLLRQTGSVLKELATSHKPDDIIDTREASRSE